MPSPIGPARRRCFRRPALLVVEPRPAKSRRLFRTGCGALSMRKRIAMAALAVAGLAGVSIAALGQTDSGGVTVIRGGKAMAQTAGEGSSNPTPPTGNAVVDRSGDYNALHSGSANAGGVIANPPPGLAGQPGANTIDRSG